MDADALLNRRLVRNAVVVRASSNYEVKELYQMMQKAAHCNETVQLFDPARVVNTTHLLAAYLNALYAFEEKRNIAKSIATEMLLFAAMTRKIDDSINQLGAKSKRGFVVFCSNKTLYKKVSKFLVATHELAPTKAEMAAAARALGAQPEDAMLMQKMALSRL